MARVPELKTAFCGCSNRDGCKVIGWFKLLKGCLCSLLGLFLSWLLSETDYDDHQVYQEWRQAWTVAVEAHDVTEVQEAVAHDVTEVQEAVGAIYNLLRVAESYIGGSTTDLLVFTVMSLLEAMSSAALLMGVYANKPELVLCFVLFSVLEDLYASLFIISFTSLSFNIFTLIGCLFCYYFTWVTYSFYKELRRNKENRSHQSSVVILNNIR